jgi:thiamine-monophosphate kinase
VPSGEGELLFSTDLLVEGVHFLRYKSSPEDVGWKAAAVNLSDIAAMGGTPVATFLSIALPKEAQGEWVERFIKGYEKISRRYNVPLLGGDTTSSLRDIVINVGVLGRAPSGRCIKRNGALAGHSIYVTGNLGDSAAGLQAILNDWEMTPAVTSLINSHMKPTPRLREGYALMNTGLIGAMMDISDGIASDLNHILRASEVGAQVSLDKIPMSDDLKSICKIYELDPYALAVGGGEDYELLFTAPECIEECVDFPVYKIGEIVENNTFRWLKDGIDTDFNIDGFNHF